MAHTCNQYLENHIISLERTNKQTRKYFYDISSNIANMNSHIHHMDTINSWLMLLKTLPTIVEKLTAMLTPAHDRTSSTQPSHPEGAKLPHSMAFHSNPLTCELHLPKVKLNKFDGSDSTG